MKAWIDILTPKQVLFFKPVIDDLEAAGCHVLATSRRYREVEPMARMAGLSLTFVGERGGRGRIEQLVAATRRQEEIIPMVSEFNPGVAVSLASGVCARVAFGMGVKHIAVNDSPHSEIAGRLSLPFSYHLLCPWIIPYGAWARFGISRSQITRYRALDPAAWLKRPSKAGPVPEVNEEKKTVVVRVEESDAPYMAGSDDTWADSVLRAVEEAFPDHNLVALCRYGHQLEEVKRKFGGRYIVPEEVVDGRALLSATDLFIGLGGTMTIEAALSGVPAVSAFQGSFLAEDYLKSVGLLAKVKNTSSLIKTSRRFLTPQFKKSYSAKSKRVLNSMEDPVPKITRFVLKTLEQG